MVEVRPDGRGQQGFEIRRGQAAKRQLHVVDPTGIEAYGRGRALAGCHAGVLRWGRSGWSGRLE